MSLAKVFFSFEGRIGRGVWWFASIIRVASVFIMLGLSWSVGSKSIIVMWLIFQIYPGLAIHIKRWHDRNKSGWWHLIGIVPFIGILWIIVELGFCKGSKNKNIYGMPTQLFED